MLFTAAAGPNRPFRGIMPDKHAAWAKLSHDIGPRDPDRGIRSGM